VVWPASGRWKCFGCGAGGDSIALLAKALNLRPLEAARLICRDFGLPVDDRPGPEACRRAADRAKQWEVERALECKAGETYSKVALIHRCIFNLLRNREDYEKYSDLIYWLPQLEHVLDELMSNDKSRQVEALRVAWRWVG